MLVFETTGNVPLIESIFNTPTSFLKEVFERLNRARARFRVIHSDIPVIKRDTLVTRANLLLVKKQDVYLQVGKKRLPVGLSIVYDEKGNEILNLFVKDYDDRVTPS